MLRFYARAAAAVAFVCLSASVALSQTSLYRYDALGRVTRASESDGRAVNYDYDAAGNRISLGSGVATAELTVKAFTASSNGGGFGGLTAANGMRDQVFNTKASSHATGSDASAWIQADLGAGQSIDRIDLAAPDVSVLTQGSAALTGAVVETSDDLNAWRFVATVGAASPGIYQTVNFGGATARYVRIRRNSGVVGLGDFRLYSGAKRTNRSPITVDDARETPTSQVIAIDPRGNDSDPDGDALTVTAAGAGALHGRVDFNSSGVTFTPTAGYVGDDSFSYTIADTYGATATGRITVTMKAGSANRSPFITDAAWGTVYDAVNTFTVGATDPDNDPLSITGVSATSGGGLVTPLGGLTFRYTPNSAYRGFDQFTLTISDGRGGSVDAAAKIWVYESSLPNHGPTAVADAVSTTRNLPVVLDPRRNDTDQDHDFLVITGVSPQSANGGTVSRAIDGASVTYSPPANFVGTDTFSYTIDDQRNATSTATVTVSVFTSDNNNPIANSDTYITYPGTLVTGDLRLNDGDPDGDPLTMVSVTQPQFGSASIASDGKHVTYTPTGTYTGTDSFNYIISDGRGGTAPGSVSVTIKSTANHPPVATDLEFTIPPNQSFTFDPTAGGSDLDNDPLTTLTIGPVPTADYPLTKGTLDRAIAGPTNDALTSRFATYTPPFGESNFSVRFGYILTDEHGPNASNVSGMSNQAGVVIHVMPTSAAAPQALSAKMAVPFEGEASTNLAALGSYTSLEIVQQPPSGSAVINGLTAKYTAASGYSGPANFTYRARGAAGAGATAAVAVTVGPYKAPPNANNANPVASTNTVNDVAYATPYTIFVLNDDTDPNGDALSLTAVSQPQHGVTKISGTAVIYSPAPTYSGPDQFFYSISDGKGGTANGTVNITVLPQGNRNPVATDDTTSTAKGAAKTIPVLTNDYDLDGDAISISGVGAAAHGSAVAAGGQITYTPVATYIGPDSFTYTIIDGRSGSATATVAVTVTAPPNTSPKVTADEYNVSINTQAFLAVRDNDSDPDGDALTISAVEQPSHGVTAISSGVIAYTPTTGYVGPDAFTYSVSDGRGGSTSGGVSVTVKPVANRAPTPVNDANVPVSANTAKTINVLSNDNDPDGDSLTIASVSTPGHGAAVISSGAITYTPTSGYLGADGFTYTVSDGKGGSASATVSISVTAAANQTPTASNDGPIAVLYNTAKTVNVLANDADPDGDALTLTATSVPPHGSAVIASGQVTYTPTAGHTGADSFTYTIGDGRGGTATATVSLVVSTAPNRPPVSVDEIAVAVTVDTAKTINVLANDSDPDGDALTITAVSTPAHGSAVIASGQITYTPTTGYSGADSFTYTISDGRGGTAIGAVGLTVGTVPNRAPTATNDSGVAVTFNTAKTINVLVNDSDPDGDALTITAVSTPAHGSAVIASGQITYTPTTGYSGADSFTYTISDGRGGTATGTVSLTVAAAPNQAPTATNDSGVAVTFNTAKTINVLANDSDPDGDALTITAVSTPAHGSAVIASGQITYTPTTGYSGADSFTYTISDGRGGTAIGTVSLTVAAAPNQAPTATNDSGVAVTFNTAKTINVLANDSDPDGDALTITAVSTPAHGSAVIASGQITYTPTTGYSGADSFTYTISDGRGGTATGTVSLTVAAGGVAELIPTGFTASSVYSDAGWSAQAYTGMTSANGMRDGNFLAYNSIQATLDDRPAWIRADLGATKTIDHIDVAPIDQAMADGWSPAELNGAIVQYSTNGTSWTAGPTISGAVNGAYKSVSLGGVSARYVRLYRATWNIGIGDFRIYGTSGGAANQSPTATNDSGVAVTFNTAKTINVLANDSDPDGDALTITAVSTPAHGSAVIASGQITYTPTTGYSGADSFTYTISDGRGGTAIGTVSLTVAAAPNQAPTATNDSGVAVTFNTAKTINVLANDSDPDGDALTITAVSTPAHGSAVIASGQITYTPTTGYSGADSFTYTISDGRGGTATGTVSLTVAAGGVAELIPTGFTSTSTYSDGGWSAQAYTGLTSANGMRDGNFLAYNSIHGTLDNSPVWIRADLGATKTIDHIDVAPISQAMADGWSPAELNGSVVEYSTNGTSWTAGPTVSGAVNGAYKSVSLGGVSARYIRLRRPSGNIGVGDFRIYGTN